MWCKHYINTFSCAFSCAFFQYFQKSNVFAIKHRFQNETYICFSNSSLLPLHQKINGMGKGRDKELITERNKRIYERYFYWTEIKRIRFDDALQILSKREFFLSESRIMQIIREMINSGYSIDGQKKIEKPLFIGFKA